MHMFIVNTQQKKELSQKRLHRRHRFQDRQWHSSLLLISWLAVPKFFAADF
jgi:hypothetical protein